jgi:predicted RND superfamily exporter protein
MRWADSFRHVKLPNGDVIHGSGRAVIFADMIHSVGQDAPRAIFASALGTILVILIAFRGSRLALGVFVPWLVGIASLVAFMFLNEIRLNFLNFVAIPITIGIGAEYAHNMMQRYRFEGRGKLRHVVRATGGALMLCSLTTSIGYFALLFSINKGIHSCGYQRCLPISKRAGTRRALRGLPARR